MEQDGTGKIQYRHLLFSREDIRDEIATLLAEFREFEASLSEEVRGFIVRTIVAPLQIGVRAATEDFSRYGNWAEADRLKDERIDCENFAEALRQLKAQKHAQFVARARRLKRRINKIYQSTVGVDTQPDGVITEMFAKAEEGEFEFTSPLLKKISATRSTHYFLWMYRTYSHLLENVSWEPYSIIETLLKGVEKEDFFELMQLSSERNTPFFHDRLLIFFQTVARLGISKEEVLKLPPMVLTVSQWHPLYERALGQAWPEEDVSSFREAFCSQPGVKPWETRED